MPDHLHTSSMPSGPMERWGGHVLATDWTVHPGWLAVGAIVLGGYLAAAVVARRRGRRVSLLRIGSFVAGIVALELVLASAIDGYAMSVFYVHMIEHLLLIMVVPALLVLGHPLTIVSDALPDRDRDRFHAVLRSNPIAVLTHPIIGFGIYALVIVATHLTGFMDQMAVHPWLMTFEQVLYVGSGWLLLLPLLGAEPIRYRLPYLPRIGLLVLAMMPDTVVGVVLMQADTDPFPVMMGMHPSWAPAPMSDIQVSGGLMWAGGDGLMMFLAVGVMVAMIASQEGRDHAIGPWLESVRRQTMVDHVNRGGAETVGVDIDPDGEDALAAYNRMLGRLNGRGGGVSDWTRGG